MALSRRERSTVSLFLDAIDRDLRVALPYETVLRFYEAVVDFTMDQEKLENNLAKVFKDCPEKLKEPTVIKAIQSVSTIRKDVINEEFQNSREVKDLLSDILRGHVSDLQKKIKDQKESDTKNKLQQAHEELMEEHRSQRERIEDRIKQLQEERQRLHDMEIQAQKDRREEKKAKEETVRIQRQIEYEQGVEDRKERKARIERQIQKLKDKLQEEHEKQTLERKEIRKKREAEMHERQQRQYVDQERQATRRKREKERERISMQARQQMLLEQQMKQRRERMEKKRQEEQQRRQVQSQLRQKLEVMQKRKLIPGMEGEAQNELAPPMAMDGSNNQPEMPA